jgi:hypothetical protein
MFADVLRQFDPGQTYPDPQSGISTEGQNRLTGGLTHTWVQDTDTATVGTQTITVPCLAKAQVSLGLRAGAENWGDIYSSLAFVRMWYPATYIITQRDRVTNIRLANGEVLWKEEESDVVGTDFKATIFDVVDIIPKTDPFSQHNENEAVLERIQSQ